MSFTIDHDIRLHKLSPSGTYPGADTTVTDADNPGLTARYAVHRVLRHRSYIDTWHCAGSATLVGI